MVFHCQWKRRRSAKEVNLGDKRTRSYPSIRPRSPRHSRFDLRYRLADFCIVPLYRRELTVPTPDSLSVLPDVVTSDRAQIFLAAILVTTKVTLEFRPLEIPAPSNVDALSLRYDRPRVFFVLRSRLDVSIPKQDHPGSYDAVRIPPNAPLAVR